MAGLRSYESMIILLPNLSKEEVDKLVDKFQNLLVSQGSEVAKVERLGKRKLAYVVKHQPEGFYCTFQFRASSAALLELERQFRLTDQVIKFQTVRILPARILKIKKPKVRPPLPVGADKAPAAV